ncbi:MAG: T9SS type A sorting domain-containing protein, partial [Bacteroidales bacterium]|nr:T9SS type A sorting domain-containing protein [Bacteroidales bacterium]
CEGNSTQLNVNAAGTAPLTYQWYKTNSIISNGISAMYLISQATTADSTYYYVKITNSCGDITSNSADVVVNASPSIDSQSGDLNQCEGTQALFDISTTGTAPLTYQWYNDDGLISGANANSYSIPLISDTDASDYFCEVNNSCGSEVSSDKTLSVKVSPTLVSQSVDTTICEGLSTALQISVMGTEPISYQWYKSSNAISGGVGAIYNLPYISTSDDAIYYGKATNDCGSAQTANINISVNELASITSQSGDSSRCENEMMSFEVAAIGTGTINYQWYKGTTSISGANMATYSLSGVLLFDAGYYHVTVSNMCNTTSSNYNLLTVNENPEVSLGNDTTFCDGGSVTLSAGYGMQSLWSNGSFNNQINVTSTGSYFVNVTDQNGCNGISDTINVNVVYPYASQSLCVVGVDTASNSNLLVWDKPNVGNIESFNLYKESTVSNVWTLIGNMPYDSLSTFVDYTSTPSIKSERYSISVVDSCGNESLKSSAHKTMHLTVNAGQSASEWNLIWNSYEGFTPATYRVYRADSSLNFIKIDSMAASSSYTYLWTDHTAPINTDVYYMIEIVHPNGGCSPSKVNTNYNSSRSNTVNSTAVNLVSLVPDFSSDKTTGAVPVMIMFYDQTTGGTIESWFWNFGDGATSDSQNPVHQYDTEGIYHVALTVTNSVGSESVVKDSYIDVLPNGVVNVYEALDVNVFPNPFKGTTNIVYNLIAETNVRIQVYSSLGKLVANIADENQKPDSYKYTFNAKDYSFGTGVYLLKMTIGDKVITKRLVQIK